MQTSKRNQWTVCLVLFILAMGPTAMVRPAVQAKTQTGSQAKSQAERQKELERLLQEMKKTSQTPPDPTQAQPAQAPTTMPNIVQRAPLPGNQLSLSYDNADLYAFITQIADLLGITPIIIDPEVKGTVTIHSSAPIAKADVLPIFNLILKNNNAALVTTGEVYQIVPISQGLRQGLKVVLDLPPEPPAPPTPAKKEEIKKEETPPAAVAKPPVTEAKPPVTGAKTAVTEAKPPVTQTGAVPVVAANPPAGAAGQNPPVAATAQKTPPAAAQEQSEELVLSTHVIRVEFVPVQSLIEPIKLFMTEGSVIMPYDRLNMLIITDYSDSVQKLLDIIRILDASYLDSELVDLVEIQYNLSADVLSDLQKVFGSGADTATGIYMVSLDRINTIMVMANSRRALEEVKRWITRLDSTTGRSVQTFIYTVKNSTASNIAMVLSLLFGGGDAGMQTTGQQGTGAPASMIGTPGGTAGRGGVTGGGMSNVTGSSRTLTSGMGQSALGGSSIFGGGTQGYGSSPYGMGAGMLGQQNVGGPRLNQNYGYSAQWLNGGQFVGLQGMVRIVADDINNSLIIQASAADYQYLLETIEKMDVLPRQAIIDARIFEIDLTDDLSFGVSAALQARTAEDHLTTGSLSGTTGALSIQTFAFVGSAREILLGLDALRQKTRVRILEAPSVLALDGTPARINVGGSIPVPTQTYVAPAGGATTGVSYKETGTSLQIVPRISASGTVTLQIYQEVSSPGAQTPNGPTFNQTAVETTLAVMDGQSVAIAGLIRESDSSARNGIPFLSDIPVLGSLFGRTSRSSNRSEILILITPHVIKNADRFQELTDEIRDSLRNVRKYVDEKQREILSDQEKARRERFEQEQKAAKKVEPPPPVKK